MLDECFLKGTHEVRTRSPDVICGNGSHAVQISARAEHGVGDQVPLRTIPVNDQASEPNSPDIVSRDGRYGNEYIAAAAIGAGDDTPGTAIPVFGERPNNDVWVARVTVVACNPNIIGGDSRKRA